MHYLILWLSPFFKGDARDYRLLDTIHSAIMIDQICRDGVMVNLIGPCDLAG